jgi:hypothetical protein
MHSFSLAIVLIKKKKKRNPINKNPDLVKLHKLGEGPEREK